MRRNVLVVDATIAAVLTILVVVLAPGLAIVGLAAILVALVCAVSFARDRRRNRRRTARRQAAHGRSATGRWPPR